jgi:KDO2-lipid IV(A) lauroyltransferase
LYYRIVAPLVGFLPGPIAYGVAILRGDMIFRFSSSSREIEKCLQQVFGEGLDARERTRAVRDHFRIRSCEPIDAIRLLGKGSALTRLVEVRGLNHLEQARANGKGAVLCSAHFGSLRVVFSLVGALGFPVTIIARWSQENGPKGRKGKQTWGWPYEKSLHLQGSNILEVPGGFDAAVKGMDVLHRNGFLGIMIDSQVEPGDLSRPLPFEFLGHQAEFVPGAGVVAQAAGAPLIVVILRRSADWRHQVLEISPPVYVQGDPVTAQGKCLALIESAVMKYPAHWNKLNPADLSQMKLIGE